MTLYAIYDPRPGQSDLPAAVPERFSWFAALLPPVFLLTHALWLALTGWLAAMLVLVALSVFLGVGAALALYLLSGLWLGLAAPSLRGAALGRRGWRHRGDRVACGPDLAQLAVLQ